MASNMEKPLKRGCKQWIVSKVHDLSLYTTVYTGFPLPVPYDFHRLCTGLSTGVFRLVKGKGRTGGKGYGVHLFTTPINRKAKKIRMLA